MKKIAIFTLQGVVNYGNRLQNYAVEKIVKDYNYRPESIILTKYSKLKPLEVKFINILNRFFGEKSERIESKRKKLFYDFNIQYLQTKYYNVNKLNDIDNKYEYSITGSDQVWNPEFDPSGIFLLPFSKKRLCITPSIAITEIDDAVKKRFKKELVFFNDISIREEKGKKMLEQLTGREVVRLIDPTMYVEVDEWKKIEKRPQKFKENSFIFSYTLGAQDIEKTEIARKIKTEMKCEICSIYDDKKENKIIAGPSEFIWLIHNSKFVITDSFHAVVFAILFHKPFLIYKRKDELKDMSSRYETLLDLFEFSNKIYDDCDVNIIDYDFEKSEFILQEERNKMKEYLDRIFMK